MARLFFAVAPSERVRNSLHELIDDADRERVQEIGSKVRWVKDADLHCTLLFLGDTDRDAATSLLSDSPPIQRAAVRLTGQTAMLGPQALVIPVTGLEPLAAAVRRIAAGFVGANATQYPQFRGHLTLGRGFDRSTYVPFVGRKAPRVTWRVGTIALMESLGDGLAYRTLCELPLLP